VNQSFSYCIRQGHTPLMRFFYHDAIGQLLETSRAELGKEREADHRTFITNIKDADVLWAVVSVNQHLDGTVWLDQDEAEIVKSYVVEVLEKRSDSSPLSLAIVLSKSDLAGPENDDETKAKKVELMETVADEFRDLAEHSRRIHAAAVFPTSAFGWDNAEAIEGHLGYSRTTKGRMEPYNVDKLLLWSLSHGLAQPKKKRDANGLDFQIAHKLDHVLGRMPQEGEHALVIKSSH
jgi:hypothetical protein